MLRMLLALLRLLKRESTCTLEESEGRDRVGHSQNQYVILTSNLPPRGILFPGLRSCQMSTHAYTHRPTEASTPPTRPSLLTAGPRWTHLSPCKPFLAAV